MGACYLGSMVIFFPNLTKLFMGSSLPPGKSFIMTGKKKAKKDSGKFLIRKRRLTIKGLTLLVFFFSIACTTMAQENKQLLTLGYPANIDVAFGKITYGADPPGCIGSSTGLNFVISEINAGSEGYTVFGLRRSKDHYPQVWKAFTRDGILFEDANMLFEAPPPDPSKKWLAGDIACRDNEIYLLLCRLGDPPLNGHPFHAFSGKADGSGWRKLDDSEYIYKGRDAVNIRWNMALGKFVNYQGSLQPYEKSFPDNIPEARRVLHIRTSPDMVQWTPGESFGGGGPYLPDYQLIVPDSTDNPDTEFYHFSVMDLGEFWAGTMVLYASQPDILPDYEPFPHGPFLGYEWWISPDGLNWQRPFRERSALEDMQLHFPYRLSDPIRIGDELRWAFPKKAVSYTHLTLPTN